MFNLHEIQDQIIQHIHDEAEARAFEIAIPDADTLRRNSKGQIEPYVAFQIQMPQNPIGESFAGVWSADFELPVNLQVVAPTADLSRGIATKLFGSMLGFGVKHGSGLRPRFGGAVMPIANNDGTVQAYIHPMSFGVKVQLAVSP